MSQFEAAIPFVLQHEGLYVNDPRDNGGATNYGISLRYLISVGALKQHPELDFNHDGLLDWQDIQFMSKDEACAIYKCNWWDAYHYGLIKDQTVAAKVLDMSVNLGPPRAHRLVQQALVSCGNPVAVDGVLGPASIKAINSTSPSAFIHVLCLLQREFYLKIVANDPAQEKFLNGWLRRSAFTGQ